MEQWQDQGVVLSVRRHGENGAIVTLLTETYGKYAGYVRGAQGNRMRGTLEVGNLVDVNWQARVSDSLGSFSLELRSSPSAVFFQDPIKLAALQSACSLCEAALPEREAQVGVFNGLQALFDALGSEIYGAAYIMWEIALLRELGFSLDLSTCAGGGDAGTLAYISPKTGRAVSYQAGEPYKNKLLNLPAFLKPNAAAGGDDDVLLGLKMTGYFLEHWVFIHHTRGLPEARVRLLERFEKMLDHEMSLNVA